MEKSSKPSSPRNKRSFLHPLGRWLSAGAFLIVVGFGALSFMGQNGVLELIRLKTLYQSLQTENVHLFRQQEELQAEVQRLNDDRHVEFLARERFGLMRPNEVFIILDSPSQQSPVDN